MKDADVQPAMAMGDKDAPPQVLESEHARFRLQGIGFAHGRYLCKKKVEACNQYGNRLPSRRYETLMLMAKWKQYELWVQSGQNKWEIVGLFPGTELATVVANARTARTRLIEVTYDGSKMMGQEIIAE